VLHVCDVVSDVAGSDRSLTRAAGISRVVADCCSTAALIAEATLSISLIVAWISAMAATDWRLISCIATICWPISSVALPV